MEQSFEGQEKPALIPAGWNRKFKSHASCSDSGDGVWGRAQTVQQSVLRSGAEVSSVSAGLS